MRNRPPAPFLPSSAGGPAHPAPAGGPGGFPRRPGRDGPPGPRGAAQICQDRNRSAAPYTSVLPEIRSRARSTRAPYGGSMPTPLTNM